MSPSTETGVLSDTKFGYRKIVIQCIIATHLWNL